MWPHHLELLRCPISQQQLEIKDPITDSHGKIKSGTLVEPHSGKTYPIIDFIPRFVSSENYANNFGFQWNLHRKTQHDIHSGLKASEVRFWKETQWEPRLDNQIILEAGSGSGRFTRFPLEAGGTVVSFDYSNAVEANYGANGAHPNLLLVQADIFNMPFEENFFDRVFCFGVLQHTPNPKLALTSLVKHLKKKGKISTDVYFKSFLSYYLNPVYYLRPLSRKHSPEKLYKAVQSYVNLVWPLVKAFRKIPRCGYQINRKILMVADHSNQFPTANDQTLKEWAYLDTFDWFSPRYDYPQTLKEYLKWHQEAKLSNIQVHRGYNGLEGRAEKN